MVNSVLNDIVESLQGLYSKWPGAKSYGIAELVRRGEGLVPGVVDDKGEIKYVGPDDTRPVISYHRLTGLNSTVAASYGNRLGDVVNTYSITLVVWMDRTKTKMSQDQMLLYIQANTPDFLKATTLSKKVIVRFTGAILNSQTVFNTEFAGTEFRLPAEKTMFQINYTLQVQFDKSCLKECPC